MFYKSLVSKISARFPYLIRVWLAVCLAAGLAFTAIPITAKNTTAPTFSGDRIILKYRDDVNSITASSIPAKYGDTPESEIPQLGIQVIKVTAGSVDQKLAAYRSDDSVLYAEPDYEIKALGSPSDTYFSYQWGLDKIQATEAWDTTQGDSSIMIAILDTGVDQNHADLASKIVANQNFTSSDTIDDEYGHGTHVAGIAAAVTNNSTGVAGVGYNCAIMNVKVVSDNGVGYNSWLMSGITWAADHGAKVINMSLAAALIRIPLKMPLITPGARAWWW
jgi:thermitase